MSKKKILYISSEIFPYLEESYISHICRYLPQGIQEKENEIRTFMPKYGRINERKHLLHEVIRLSGQNIIIEDSDHPLIIKVASLQAVRMQIYFIDSEDFFKRKQLFRDEGGNFFPDNDSRAIFFAKGVVETVCKLGWAPDIIHCHGWITGLVPMFLKTLYKDNPFFQDTRVVYSLYNDQFDEKFDVNFAKKLELTDVPATYLDHFKNPSFESLQKSAIDFSDGLVIGHPDVESDLKAYAGSTGRLLLTHPTEDNYVDQYDEFYNKILAQAPLTF